MFEPRLYHEARAALRKCCGKVVRTGDFGKDQDLETIKLHLRTFIDLLSSDPDAQHYCKESKSMFENPSNTSIFDEETLKEREVFADVYCSCNTLSYQLYLVPQTEITGLIRRYMGLYAKTTGTMIQ